jgi:TonB family protein
VLTVSARASGVQFVPFVDKRWGHEGVDGALGLDFFAPYAVYASWHASTYYLKARGDAGRLTLARLGRWGKALPSCPHAGCITFELLKGASSVGLKIVRDPEGVNKPLEIYLGATSPSGVPVAPLVVELPSGVNELVAGIPLEYQGASLAVLDAAPFPRACVGDRGCLAQLGGPIAGNLELSPIAPGTVITTAPPPVAPVASKTIALDKLHRVTGELVIAPNEEVSKLARQKPLGLAIVKVCVTREGKVDSTAVTKSSGVAAYDEQLEATIKETWSFEPLEIAPDATPCATFLLHQ